MDVEEIKFKSPGHEIGRLSFFCISPFKITSRSSPSIAICFASSIAKKIWACFFCYGIYTLTYGNKYKLSLDLWIHNQNAALSKYKKESFFNHHCYALTCKCEQWHFDEAIYIKQKCMIWLSKLLFYKSLRIFWCGRAKVEGIFMKSHDYIFKPSL